MNLQKTKINKIVLSVSPSRFPHQVHNIRIKKQLNFPSERKLNSDRHVPTASETGIKKLASHRNQTGILLNGIS